MLVAVEAEFIVELLDLEEQMVDLLDLLAVEEMEDKVLQLQLDQEYQAQLILVAAEVVLDMIILVVQEVQEVQASLSLDMQDLNMLQAAQ